MLVLVIAFSSCASIDRLLGAQDPDGLIYRCRPRTSTREVSYLERGTSNAKLPNSIVLFFLLPVMVCSLLGLVRVLPFLLDHSS